MNDIHPFEQLTIDGYDLIAKHFDGTRRNFWSELSYISDFVRDGDIVLDVGSGNSRLYELLKHKQITYIGSDASIGMVRIARERYPHLTIHHNPSHHIPLGDNSVQVVVSLALIHHLTEEGLKSTLSEIHRVLNSGGTLIATTWNIGKSRRRDILKQYILGIFKKNQRVSFGEIIIPFSNLGNLRFVKNYTKRKLYKLLTEAGFTNIHITKEERSIRSENLAIIAIKK